MCLMKGAGGRGPCALGAPRRRQGEAAAHAAADLRVNRRVGPRVTPSTRPILGQDAESRLLRRPNDGRARLGRREVGLEEEVEERRGALEVHEEERDGELDLRGSSSASPWNLISTRGSTLNGTHQQTGTNWCRDAKTK